MARNKKEIKEEEKQKVKDKVIQKEVSYRESHTITPFYINTDRLLDECAILWDGYSTFSEVSSATSKEVSGEASASVGASFKAWNVGPEVSADIKGDITHVSHTNCSSTRVQTAASLLSKFLLQCQSINDFEIIGSTKEDNIVSPSYFIGKLVGIDKAKLERTDNNIRREISEKLKNQIDFWQRLQLRLRKEYSKLNGITFRSFLKIRFQVAKSDYYGYANLSRKYFYQSELDDILGAPLKYLVKVIDYQEDSGFRFEVVAIYQ